MLFLGGGSLVGVHVLFEKRLLHGAVARLDLAQGSLVGVHVLFLKRLLHGAVARIDLAPRVIPYEGDALVRSFG